MLFENLSLAVADNDFYNHSHSGFASHGDVNDKNNYYYNNNYSCYAHHVTFDCTLQPKWDFCLFFTVLKTCSAYHPLTHCSPCSLLLQQPQQYEKAIVQDLQIPKS